MKSWQLAAVPLFVLACSVDRREVESTGPDAAAGAGGTGGVAAGGTTSTGGSTAAGSGGGGGSGGSAGVGTIVGGAGGGSPDAGDAATCVVSSQTVALAKSKVDVVLAVDTSSSMVQLLDEIETGTVALFNAMSANALDPRIIMLADDWICVPAPLGSGLCNNGKDTNTSYLHYQHFVVPIGNADALDQVLASYTTWKQALRADAVARNVIIVSDDNSGTPYSQFSTAWSAKDPPLTTGWKFSSFVTKTQCSSGGIGTEYLKLTAATGGTELDLCLAFAQPSSDPAGFGAKLGLAFAQDPAATCHWYVPYPPQGSILDPDHLAVEFTNKAGFSAKVPKVSDASKCSPLGGWWYDGSQPKKKVMACPATCDAVRQTAGSISLTFGCPG